MSMRLIPASVFACLLLAPQFISAAAPPCTVAVAPVVETKFERRLGSPISANFENAPLKAVIDELRDVSGINIVIDDPALQELGISLESPITIKLDQETVMSAMNLILEKVHLIYVIKDEMVQITTEEQVQYKSVTAIYPVADLLGPPVPPRVSALLPKAVCKHGDDMKEELIGLICRVIQPRSWTEMGGPGTITYAPTSKALVITQSFFIHEQVVDLLAALRQRKEKCAGEKPSQAKP